MRLKDHEAIGAARDYFMSDPRKLTIDPNYNIRDLDAPDEREELDELKQQIRTAGVLVPLEIRMRGEDAVIVSGHRRHKVVLELIAEGEKIDLIPTIPERKTTNDEERDLNLILSNGGSPLKPMAKVAWLRRMMDVHAWDDAKILQRTGWSRQVLSNLMTLMTASSESQRMVKDSEVSATTVIQEVRRSGAEAATETLRAAKQEANSKGETKVRPAHVRQVANNQPPRQSSLNMPRTVPSHIQEALDTLREINRECVSRLELSERADDEIVEFPVLLLKRAHRAVNKLNGGEDV